MNRLLISRKFGEFYQNFYSEGLPAYTANIDTKVQIVRIIEKILKGRKGVSILEVGSGFGELAKVILEMFDGKIQNYVCTEISKTCLQIHKKTLRNYGKIVNSVYYDLIYPEKSLGKFDIVICSEVMEHLTDFEKEIAFLNIALQLNNGGYFIYSSPIQEYIPKRIYLSPSSKDIEKRVNSDFGNARDHIGVPSINEIVSLFYRKGFANVRYFPLHMLIPKSPKNYLLKAIHRIAVWMSLLVPKWFRVYITPGIVLVGIKKHNPDYNHWYNDKKYLYKFMKAKGTNISLIEKQYIPSKKKLHLS